MYVMGVESSCDETSVAIVKDGKTVLSRKNWWSDGGFTWESIAYGYEYIVEALEVAGISR